MKHFLPILSIAFCLLLTACGGDEPNVYDKVSGHTYVANITYGDTLHFNSDGTYQVNSRGTYLRSYQQDERLVILEQYIEGQTKLLEAMDGKLVDWKSREGIIYYRIR